MTASRRAAPVKLPLRRCAGAVLLFFACCVSVPDATVKGLDVSKTTTATPQLDAGRDATSYVFQFGGWGSAAGLAALAAVWGRRGQRHKASAGELAKVRDGLMVAIESEGAAAVKSHMQIYPDLTVRNHVARRQTELKGR